MQKSFLDSVGCPSSGKPMQVFDWLSALPKEMESCPFVEVQFKHNRKDFFINEDNILLEKGDIVAVEASPGHDIGEVTLTGKLSALKMKKTFRNGLPQTFKKIYRKANTYDWQKYKSAKEKEYPTMIRARKIAEYLNLEMKIGDVEFQGDGGKATFYYVANGRVDFRELIKFFVQEFKVRIEMKQIGVRQESGRIGGLGPCGRPLCCSSWMRYFSSVSTTMAHYQDLGNNLPRITGQCTKLKCCLNFELDTYIEAQQKLPSREVVLQTQDKEYYFFKADVLKGEVSYSTTKGKPTDVVVIPIKRAFEIIEMNNNGEKPNYLSETNIPKTKVQRYTEKDVLSGDRIDRFFKKQTPKKAEKKNKDQEETQPKPKENAPKKTQANPPQKKKKSKKPKVEEPPIVEVSEEESSDDKLLDLI